MKMTLADEIQARAGNVVRPLRRNQALSVRAKQVKVYLKDFTPHVPARLLVCIVDIFRSVFVKQDLTESEVFIFHGVV